MTGATAMLLLAGFARMATADVITIGGLVTQSTQDGTGPTLNNLSLSNIADGDSWQISLAFDGFIAGPGTYNNLPNATLAFSDPSALASEASFDSISMTIADVGGFDQFSVFACLTTGGGCFSGNQLSASFQISDAALKGQNVSATGQDQPHPLDLLEDDGTTDLQGSINGYSYTAASTLAPEPTSTALLFGALALLSAGHRLRGRHKV